MSAGDPTGGRASPLVRAILVLAALFLGVAARAGDEDARPPIDPRLLRRLYAHSPLPPAPPDPTNKVADDPRAARLGAWLFHDARLSADGTRSCATCHDPARSFTDGRSLARGALDGTRNVPSLWNVAWQRWYFWDGRADSVWAQALQPLEHDAELASSRVRVAKLVATDPGLRAAYAAVFGAPPDLSDPARFPDDAKPVAGAPDDRRAVAWAAMREEDRAAATRVFANVGKAIAAFERRLVSRDSAFDRWIAALRAGDAEAERAYPEAARRGALLFVGKANCRLCHAGPTFSDGEFHDVGVPTLDRTPPRDAGRLDGLAKLLDDPFNAAGAYSDDRQGERARELALLARSNEAWGQFKTPTLRNVWWTAPYMHQGQYGSLADVVHHYSAMEDALPAGHHGETILRPLGLTSDEEKDLLAFLESLSDQSALPSLARPPSPGTGTDAR